VLTLLVLLVALVPLADASLVDPLWIAGIYDRGDFDEIVGAVTDSDSLLQSLVPLVRRESNARGIIVPGVVVAGTSATPLGDCVRAPPA
jgi:hypothetical protein